MNSSKNNRYKSQEVSENCPQPLSEMECDRKAMLFWCGAGKPEGQYPIYRKAVEDWNKAGSIDSEFGQYLKELRDTERLLQQLDKEAAQYLQEDDSPDEEYKFYREAIEEYKVNKISNENDFKVFLRKKRASKYTLSRKILIIIFLILLTLLGLITTYLLITPGSQFTDLSSFYFFLISGCICIFCLMRPFWPLSLRKKSSWDWLVSIFIPIVVASSAFWVVLHDVRVGRESLQKTIEVQQEQNRQQVLKDYISQMTTLISDNKLGIGISVRNKIKPQINDEQKITRNAVNALTRSTIDVLETNTQVKGKEIKSLLQFLKSTELIRASEPFISINGITINNPDLMGINLNNTDLSKISIYSGDMRFALLKNSKLQGASLLASDLRMAQLQNSDLRSALLFGSNFAGANLTDVNLEGASLHPGKNIYSQRNLGAADFSQAIVTRANFQGVIGLSASQKILLKKGGAIVD